MPRPTKTRQLKTLQSETRSWNGRVNRSKRRILWKFNVDDARRKFKLMVDTPQRRTSTRDLHRSVELLKLDCAA